MKNISTKIDYAGHKLDSSDVNSMANELENACIMHGDALNEEDNEQLKTAIINANASKIGIGHLVNAIKNNVTDANHDIDFIAGIKTPDSTGTKIMISTAMTKRTDAVFVAGTNQGMMDRRIFSSVSVTRARTSNIATLTFADLGDFSNGTYTVNIYGFGGTGYNLKNVEVTITGGDTVTYACPGGNEVETVDGGGNFTTDKKDGCTLHIFQIMKQDKTTDYIASLNPTTPDLSEGPGYVYYGRLWSLCITTSDYIKGFTQFGKQCLWKTRAHVLQSAAGSGDTRTLFTTLSPLGIITEAHGIEYGTNTNAASSIYTWIKSPQEEDVIPSGGNNDLRIMTDTGASSANSVEIRRMTDTSAQLAYRKDNATNCILNFVSLGYTDFQL